MEATNFVEWANAIDAHPETDDAELVVAVRLASGESVCTGCIKDEFGGLELCDNCDSASHLEWLGFLFGESQVTTETANGGSGMIVYSFRLPEKAA
ncbi:hypothetical protein [Mycobacterium sp. D16R24]|uniref:hypothetical protein n=1 Tax=Mycobacterium sp. D16R24 TaxID=1855656 RepID=UPI000992A184|nr:hypothetical protein [Mycobacterium sp. D16R24]